MIAIVVNVQQIPPLEFLEEETDEFLFEKGFAYDDSRKRFTISSILFKSRSLKRYSSEGMHRRKFLPRVVPFFSKMI